MNRDGIALHFLPRGTGEFDGFIAVAHAELRNVGLVNVRPIEPVPFVPWDNDYLPALWFRQQHAYLHFMALAPGSVDFQ